ncbi:nuclear transport factor 2 family protein [Lutimonas sp.]|uniref:nuclear transport factor 2 family protein n=1 Tax=Lutimonas sp. TaxID=1872403 RepID=UPI003D9AD8DC
MKQLQALFTVMAIFLLGNVYAQELLTQEKKEVKQVIIDLFDGMREGDSAKVGALFGKDVQMYTSYTDKDGELVLKKGALAPFLKAVGSPHDKIWDEKIWDTTIELSMGIAQVWTEYAFYLGSDFSHCGVDAFHLAKDASGKWKIMHLMDTRKKEGCKELPGK